MWGIPDQQADARRGFRFIPTYVGHTTARHIPRCRWTVHPHLRGAYAGRAGGAVRHVRFIPTYVGHTSGPRSCMAWASVHPHIRGAYGQIAQRVHRRGRFIPTYVGHTTSAFPPTQARSVHPHIRGAYLLFSISRWMSDWFIPTYVGHTGQRWGCRGWGRFIPTYVGHTLRQSHRQRCHPVHPHIRGAYSTLTFLVASHAGSSPHTWGILEVVRGVIGRARFIPTYVGHTRH